MYSKRRRRNDTPNNPMRKNEPGRRIARVSWFAYKSRTETYFLAFERFDSADRNALGSRNLTVYMFQVFQFNFIRRIMAEDWRTIVRYISGMGAYLE